MGILSESEGRGLPRAVVNADNGAHLIVANHSPSNVLVRNDGHNWHLMGKSENALEPVRLVVLRAARGGVPVEPVAAPDYSVWSRGSH